MYKNIGFFGTCIFVCGVTSNLSAASPADAVNLLHNSLELVAKQVVSSSEIEVEIKSKGAAGDVDEATYAVTLKEDSVLDARFHPRDKTIVALATNVGQDFDNPCKISILKYNGTKWNVQTELQVSFGKDYVLSSFNRPIAGTGAFVMQRVGRIIWNSEGSALLAINSDVDKTQLTGFTIWHSHDNWQTHETVYQPFDFFSTTGRSAWQLYRPIVAWQGEHLVMNNGAALLRYKIGKGFRPEFIEYIPQMIFKKNIAHQLSNMFFVNDTCLIALLNNVDHSKQRNAAMIDMSEKSAKGSLLNVGPNTRADKLFLLEPLKHATEQADFITVARVADNNPQEILIGQFWPKSRTFTFEQQKGGESANALHANSGSYPVTSVAGFVAADGKITVAATYVPRLASEIIFGLHVWRQIDKSTSQEWVKYNLGSPVYAIAVDMSHDGTHLLVKQQRKNKTPAVVILSTASINIAAPVVYGQT